MFLKKMLRMALKNCIEIFQFLTVVREYESTVEPR